MPPSSQRTPSPPSVGDPLRSSTRPSERSERSAPAASTGQTRPREVIELQLKVAELAAELGRAEARASLTAYLQLAGPRAPARAEVERLLRER